MTVLIRKRKATVIQVSLACLALLILPLAASRSETRNIFYFREAPLKMSVSLFGHSTGHSGAFQLLEYQMYKRGEALSDTLGKLTSAPLAGGHTPREGGSLGTGVWRGGSKGGSSHPSHEG